MSTMYAKDTIKVRSTTYKKWIEDGTDLFGASMRNWRFVCPACGYIARLQDWIDAKATPSEWASSCLGNWRKDVKSDAFSGKPGPCTFNGSAMPGNPVMVISLDGTEKHVMLFEFAPVVIQSSDSKAKSMLDFLIPAARAGDASAIDSLRSVCRLAMSEVSVSRLIELAKILKVDHDHDPLSVSRVEDIGGNPNVRSVT